MTELELITRYQELNQMLDHLQRLLPYTSNLIKQDEMEFQIKILFVEKQELQVSLVCCKNQGVTNSKINSIISAISGIHAILRKSEGHLRLTKNQGSIVDNYLFGKIRRSIQDAFESNIGWYYIPQFFQEIGGGFDCTNLRLELEWIMKELDSGKYDNYISLELYIEKAQESLLQLAYTYDD